MKGETVMKKRLATVFSVLLVFMSIMQIQHSVNASTLDATVTSIADSGPGSLRAALASGISGDTINITFDISDTEGNTIVLASPIAVSGGRYLNIDGENGVNCDIVISGNDSICVFTVEAGSALSLKNVSVTHGKSELGGGVYNEGALTAFNTIFSENSAISATTPFSAHGGAIYCSSSSLLSLSYCTISNNTASGCGGGIYSESGQPSNVFNCNFSNNSSGISGGSLFDGGSSSLLIQDCTFGQNSAVQSGGGVYLASGLSPAIFLSCSFSNNTASIGAGLYNSITKSLTILASSFVNNTSSQYGGGLYNAGIAASDKCTYINNIASIEGGGILNSGTMTTINCTLYGNSCTAGSGGAISTGNILTADHCTLLNNSSINNAGGIWGSPTSNSIILSNSILWQSPVSGKI
jgi:parallel beta-helix repeat protein